MVRRSVILLAAAAFLTLTVAAPTLCSSKANTSAKTSEVIVLQHISPHQVMQHLKLVDEKDAGKEKATTWFRSTAPSGKENALIPLEVDAITPYEPDMSLIVYGTSQGISELRIIIGILDVEPKSVRVKADVYRLTLEQFRKMGILEQTAKDSEVPDVTTLSNPAAADKLIKALQASDIRPLSSPAVTTFSNTSASIQAATTRQSANGEEEFVQLTVFPRVNGDNTITIRIEHTVAGFYGMTSLASLPAERRNQIISTSRRIADGDTIVLSGCLRAESEVTLVLLTPTIVK